MPKKVPFNGTVFIRCDDEDTESLRKIEAEHNIAPTKFTAGLIRAACQFYRKHGWFSFPVVIEPEVFQARYVAEEQAAYEAGKKPKKKP
jgi:hypothetical protein